MKFQIQQWSLFINSIIVQIYNQAAQINNNTIVVEQTLMNKSLQTQNDYVHYAPFGLTVTPKQYRTFCNQYVRLLDGKTRRIKRYLKRKQKIKKHVLAYYQKLKSKQKFFEQQKVIVPGKNKRKHRDRRIKFLGNYPLYRKLQYHVNNPFGDNRLFVFSTKYFLNKRILDIGCNQGFLDVGIAAKYNPQMIIGLDIDQKLIKDANRLIKKHHTNKIIVQEEFQKLKQKIRSLSVYHQQTLQNQFMGEKEFRCQKQMDISFHQQNTNEDRFPHNVKFICDNFFNFISTNEQKPTYKREANQFQIEIQSQKEFDQKYCLTQSKGICQTEPKCQLQQFDTILCLNITKWIHLTYGDDGIKQLFQKIYQHLKKDGVLICQFQTYKSYKEIKTMDLIYGQNLSQIVMNPQSFESQLLNLGFQRILEYPKLNHNLSRKKHIFSVYRKRN